jgi:hypothetical protein
MSFQRLANLNYHRGGDYADRYRLEYVARDPHPDDAWGTEQARLSIQVDLQYDSKPIAGRSATSGGDDQAEFLRERFSAACTRATKTGCCSEFCRLCLLLTRNGLEWAHIAGLSQTEKLLAKLPSLDCTICGPDISAFYDISAELHRINTGLVHDAASHPQGNKLLSSGRVVMLYNKVCQRPG